MKKSVKALLLVLCAVVLVVATVFTTIAYMASQTATITNTFSVGNVKITMDESVYADGVLTSERAPDGNNYKMIPGNKYVKDPIIHVDGTSEDAYIFVKVVKTNTAGVLEGLEMADGWVALTGAGNENIYYNTTAYSTVNKDKKDFAVFAPLADATADGETVKVATTVKNDATAAQVEVTGYAIQATGFDSAQAAWDAAIAAGDIKLS